MGTHDRLDMLDNPMEVRKLMILHPECVPHSDLLLQLRAADVGHSDGLSLTFTDQDDILFMHFEPCT